MLRQTLKSRHDRDAAAIPRSVFAWYTLPRSARAYTRVSGPWHSTSTSRSAWRFSAGTSSSTTRSTPPSVVWYDLTCWRIFSIAPRRFATRRVSRRRRRSLPVELREHVALEAARVVVGPGPLVRAQEMGAQDLAIHRLDLTDGGEEPGVIVDRPQAQVLRHLG